MCEILYVCQPFRGTVSAGKALYSLPPNIVCFVKKEKKNQYLKQLTHKHQARLEGPDSNKQSGLLGHSVSYKKYQKLKSFVKKDNNIVHYQKQLISTSQWKEVNCTVLSTSVGIPCPFQANKGGRSEKAGVSYYSNKSRKINIIRKVSGILYGEC